MKTYSNIGDLYREKFSDYAPNPPAEVWERIQLSMDKKKVAVKQKIAVVATAIVLISTVTYFLTDISPTVENTVENQLEETIVAGNNPPQTVDIVEEKGIFSQNEHRDISPKKEVPVETVSPYFQIADVSNNEDFTPNKNAEIIPSVEQKTEKEAVKEKEETKEKTEEKPTKALPPIVVSKDTTICENATLKLVVLHAKNVQWSTGETKNSILVNPSSDEVYSATFSTENQYDTTVFIRVKCIRCSELLVPSAFTPNGDGLNDVFKAQSDEEYSYFEMTIYPVNGNQPLFSTKNIKYGWDGMYKNVLQPHGAYRYIIRYKDATGKMLEKTYIFLLISQ